MTATVAQAEQIIARLAGQRVRLECDDYTIEGRLRPGLGRWKDSGARIFRIFGRSSNWRAYAEQFRADPDVYRRVLRSAARPKMHYVRADAADRIKAAP